MAREPQIDANRIIILDAQSPAPLFRQIFFGLRDGILAGELRPGTQLPSTRLLALDLGVSRLTVQNAYEALIGEGYAVGRHGSGTYVNAGLPGPLSPSGKVVTSDRPQPPHRRRIARSAAQWPHPPQPSAPVSGHRYGFAFQLDMPAIDAFPHPLWGKLLGRRWRTTGHDLLLTVDEAGYPPLRAALADYLAAERGVRCTVEQIMIVGGVQQAIDLAVRILLDPGDKAWVEEPGQPHVRAALISAGARPSAVPVDGDGLNVAVGMFAHSDARLAVVTPAHQWPTTVVMSLHRRLALLEWASRAGAWVVEDDHGGELFYDEHPPAPLFALDQQQRVLHIGSFDRLLFPALHLGYLIAPLDLVEPLLHAKALVTSLPSLLEQAVLADFMSDGHFAHHIRHTRSLYQARQMTLVANCQRMLGEQLEVKAATSGLHLVGWLPTGWDDRQLSREAAAQGLTLTPLSTYRSDADARRALLLGYGALPARQIEAAVQRLAALFRRVA